jgi:hypothetical protein
MLVTATTALRSGMTPSALSTKDDDESLSGAAARVGLE